MKFDHGSGEFVNFDHEPKLNGRSKGEGGVLLEKTGNCDPS